MSISKPKSISDVAIARAREANAKHREYVESSKKVKPKAVAREDEDLEAMKEEWLLTNKPSVQIADDKAFPHLTQQMYHIG